MSRLSVTETARLVRERDEARAHARDHHLEACESCAVTESDLLATQRERDEARAERDRIRATWMENHDTEQRARIGMQTERDETRAALDVALSNVRAAREETARAVKDTEEARAILRRAVKALEGCLTLADVEKFGDILADARRLLGGER